MRWAFGAPFDAGDRNQGTLGVASVRFCAYQYQHLPLDELARRWLVAERLNK
jgi:hypothetical protein